MKKTTFAAGIVATIALVLGVLNPLAYINAFSFIDNIIVGGTMSGIEGFIGMFIMLVVIMTHTGFVFMFWAAVIKRIKEINNK